MRPGDYDYNHALTVFVAMLILVVGMAIGGLLLALFGFGLLT
jgi:hypothetical protein